MHMTANLMSPKPAPKVQAEKPIANVTKNAANSGNQQQEKKFSDILEQVEDEISIPKDKETKQPMDLMPGMSGFNPVVVTVDVSAIPIVQIAAEQEIAASAPDLIGLREPLLDFPTVLKGLEQSQTPKQAQLDFPTALKGMEQPEVPAQNNFLGNQITENSAEKTSGESLLDLLNGKVTQNIQQAKLPNTLADIARQAPDPQLEGMQIPVQIVDETKGLDGEKISLANVPVQPVLKEDSSAKNVKPPAVLQEAKEVDSQRGPLRVAQETQGQMADSDGKSDLSASLPKQANANLIPKEPEPTGQQQFSHFVANTVSLRTDSTVTQQTTAAQGPDQLEKFDIPGQIVQQARLIKTNEDTQMVIKLRPEHLGDLTLKVTVENGVVSASFHSDNAQVRTMLETTLMQLKQELIDQGIKVNNVSVYAGMGQSLPDKQGQQQTGREQQSARYKNRKIDLADFEDEAGKVSALGTDVLGQDGVDYRV